MTNEQLEVQLAAFAARQQVHRQLIGWFVANFVNQDDDPAGVAEDCVGDAFSGD